MDYKQIDKRLKASIDIEFYTKLNPIEEIIYDLKYTRSLKNHQIAEEVKYGTTKIKKIVNNIRCKYMEYINAREV